MSRKSELIETISTLIAQRPEDVARRALQVWQALAAELIPVIGETGFATLFARSLYRNQTLFPWLASTPAPQQPQVLQHSATQFTTLKVGLQTRSFTEATAANQALLITFTDILIVLIGEPLTIGILCAAWGDDASEITNKELPHE